MSHLTDETLARLVEEAPTALEAAHLSACAACRAELQAMHEQVSQLAALPELRPPPGDWEALERRLAAEGLIRIRPPRRIWLHQGIRAAAAVAFFVTGTLTGRLLLPAPAGPGLPLATAEPPAKQEIGPAPLEAEPVAAGAPLAAGPARPAAGSLASKSEPVEPRTPEEWTEYLRRTESAYLDALTRFAELSGAAAMGDPAARLAALEGIVLTTRAALGRAPTDAVINGYYLNAVAQRDATLRQISATSAESWF